MHSSPSNLEKGGSPNDLICSEKNWLENLSKVIHEQCDSTVRNNMFPLNIQARLVESHDHS